MSKYIKKGRTVGPKVIISDKLIEMYKRGMSLPDVCSSPEGKDVSMSTLRSRLLEIGLLRGRNESIILAASQGKLGNPGIKRIFTDEWKENISKGQLARWEDVAIGKSLKPNGYLEITKGENKGRSEHVVIMEAIIGRRLFAYECVHHINGVRSDNRPENLKLMTREEHSRHHAIEKLPQRKRMENGQWENQ